MPASASSGHTRTDLARAIKALGAVEEAAVALPLDPYPPLRRPAPLRPPQALATPADLPRTIPGLTPLAAPPMTTTSALTSSTTADAAPARRPANPPAAPAWQIPAKVARRARQPAPVPALPTQPVLRAPVIKPSVAPAPPSTPAAAASSTVLPSAAASGKKALSARHKSKVAAAKGRPLRPEQEWFALFKGKGMGKGGMALGRVKELARMQLDLVNKYDASGRNALSHAIAGGKVDAVTWLMAHECYVAPASAARFLDEVTAQVDLYSASFGAALGRFLARQSTAVKEELRRHFARNPPLMQGIVTILAECGLSPAATAMSTGVGHAGRVNQGQAGKEMIAEEPQALDEYHTPAGLDPVEAQYNLGARLALGLGVVKDEEAAVKWYTKAARQGHAAAQYSLGVMLLRGTGTTRDEEAASEWLGKAAAQGYLCAQGLLRHLGNRLSVLANDE
jgi:hypothetical protein